MISGTGDFLWRWDSFMRHTSILSCWSLTHSSKNFVEIDSAFHCMMRKAFLLVVFLFPDILSRFLSISQRFWQLCCLYNLVQTFLACPRVTRKVILDQMHGFPRQPRARTMKWLYTQWHHSGLNSQRVVFLHPSNSCIVFFAAHVGKGLVGDDSPGCSLHVKTWTFDLL